MNREKYDRPNQIAHALTLSGRHSRQRHEFQSKNIKKKKTHTQLPCILCDDERFILCAYIFWGRNT